jgi:hypothetical protein
VNTVVAAAAGDTGKLGVAERLGIETDMVVQELGWDEDVDDDVRAAIEEVIGGDLLDEDSDEVVDVVLLWWRDQDGDLVDTLVDARTPLADNGVIWVLTPKTGRDGHVEPSDLAEAAPTVGLAQTSNLSVSEDWPPRRRPRPDAEPASRCRDLAPSGARERMNRGGLRHDVTAGRGTGAGFHPERSEQSGADSVGAPR